MRNFNTFFKQRPWLCWLYIAYGTWLLAMPLAAQDISVELDPVDGTLSQSIGTSVAIGSQIAVIGAPGSAANKGAAYVFELQNGTWVQTSKIVSTDGTTNHRFGTSVATSGNLIVVGATGVASNQGAVYVFSKSGSTWVQIRKLMATDGQPNSLFGASVAISGSYIAVGAPEDNQVAEDAGAAYLFRQQGTNLANWTQAQKVVANDGILEDEFGCSVSLNGNRLAVGSRYSDVAGPIPTYFANAGAAYIFTVANNAWTQTYKRTANDPNINDHFGNSLSLTDNFLLVGAYGDDAAASNAGAAYVFSGATLATQTKLMPVGIAANSDCGYGVSISQNTAIIGSRYANGGKGRAFVYVYNGTNWNQFGAALNPSVTGNDAAQFGAAVGIANNVVIVGALEEDANGTNSGSAYLYEMLSQPLAVNASDGGYETHVQIGWTPRAGTSATGYKVYKYKNDTLIDTFINPSNPFIDANVVLGTNYDYCVAATHPLLGESQAFCDMGFKGTIAAPTNFTASDGIFEDHIDLNWSGSTALNVDDSILLYKNGGIIDTLGGAVNSYTITDDIFSGIAYEFCLQRYYTQHDTTYTLLSTTFDLDTIVININSLTDPNLPYLSVLDTLSPTNYLVETIDTINLVNTYDTTVVSTPILSEMVCNTGNITVSAPSLLTATYQTYEDHVALMWMAGGSAVAENYKIYRNGSLLATIPSTYTQFDDYNTVSGELYEYCVVSASNTFGESEAACGFGGTLLLKPTSIAATDGIFENKINITWALDPSTVCSGVRIYRDSMLIANVPAFLGATGYDDVDVQGLTIYDYCIEAYNNVWGTSSRICDKGNIKIIKPQITATTGAPNHEDRVVLTWTSPSAVDDGFQIYRNNALIATINNPNTLTYTDLNVTSLQEYEYSISAYDISLGNSERDTTVGKAAIKQPTTIAANTNPNSITVIWGASPTILTGYQYRIYRNNSLVGTVPSSILTYTDANVTPDNIYQYCVTTYKAGLGESELKCINGSSTQSSSSGYANNIPAPMVLLNPDDTQNDGSGFDVSVLPNGWVAVGAPTAITPGGRVHVFKSDSEGFTKSATLYLSPASQNYARFGEAVSLTNYNNNIRLAIGASGWDLNGSTYDVGIAQLFKYTPATGWIFFASKSGVNTNAFNLFGKCLAWKDDALAIGEASAVRLIQSTQTVADFNSTPTPYTFSNVSSLLLNGSSGNWQPVVGSSADAKVYLGSTANFLSGNAGFGRSIAQNAETLVVGGETGTSGTVKVYNLVSGTWNLAQSLRRSDFGMTNTLNWGQDVAIAGNILAIYDYSYGNVYLYQKLDNKWVPYKEIQGNSSTGNSLAMAGKLLVVGNPSEFNRGAAFVYVMPPDAVAATDGQYTNLAKVQWSTANYASSGLISGFHIYRNGESIGETGPTASIYSDNSASPGVLYEYCVEAYGSWGASFRACDKGYVRPQGRISGTVTSQQQAGVANVEVCALSTQGQHALSLNGLSDGATLEAETGINLNASKYTIEYWAKSNTTANNFIRLGDDASNNININITANGNEWHHYAHVFAGSQDSLFVDGVFASSTAAAALNTTIGKLRIGNPASGMVQIDELRIWDIARNEIDLQRDMPRYLRGDEAGLKGYWSFNEGTGTTAATYVQGSNGHAKLTNTYWTYDRPDVNYCADTDPSGYYEIPNIAFGEELEFTIVPSKGDHVFSPQQQVRTLTSSNNLANNVNFTDNSTFTLSGDIYYNGTVCKQQGVRILVNGAYLGNDTDAQGHFAISVTEPDEYILTPQFQDHTFVPPAVNLGYVDANLGDILIQNTTLRTITGTVRGACNALIGDVTVQVSSSPSCINYDIDPTSSPYSFNPDNGRFQLQVPPLKYNVRVTDVQQGGQVNVQAINYFFSRSQVTNLVDSTNVEDTLNFVFNKPFDIEIQDLPTQKTCNGLAYVLSTQDEHALSFSIFQDYDGNLCPADSGTLYINDNVSGVGAVSIPFYNGAGYYTLKPDYPNIVAPYLKTFYVSAEVNGGYTETKEISVLVTGSKPRESTFVTKFPERPDFILRDPGGDGSYGYLSADSSICKSQKWKYEINGSFGNNQTVAVGAKFLLGLGFAVQTEIENTLRWDMSLGVGSEGEGGYQTCTTALTEFKTPDNPLFTGPDGNTYIGGGLNMIYAASDVVEYNNCAVKRDTALAISPLEYRTKFIYTQNHIKVSLIPQFEQLSSVYKSDSISAMQANNVSLAKQKGDSARLYDIQKKLWQDIIGIEQGLTTTAFKGTGIQNYSFSGGTSFQSETAAKTTRDSTYFVLQKLDTEVAFEIKAKVNNTGVEGSRYVRFSETFGKAWGDATEYNNKVGYVLTDDDIGDYFSIDVAKDEVYGVPVFKTVSGRSSCPHEVNTQSRDLPYIVLNSPAFQGDVPPDDAAVFNINFGNNSPSGEAWPFRVQALTANNLYGATILLNGSMETGGQVDYFIPAGQEIQSQVYVLRGPTEYNYDNLAVMIYTPCEYNNWLNGGGLGNVDTVFFSVHFQSPCSDVTLVTPIDNWLVQQQDNNNLQITMAGYDATGLKGVLLEYRDDAAGGEWITIEDIADTILLNATYPDSYTHNWNVGSLPDGKYVIRATAYCQTATGSATSSSQELHGTIDRAFNGLYGIPQPADGLLEPGDELSINFNENINCLQPVSFNPGAQISLVDIATGYALQYGTDYYVQCSGSGINFVMSPSILLALDGHLVQAQVGGIKDVFGNVLFTPKVWSFIVLQREVYWSPTTINLTMYQGDSQTIPLQLINTKPLAYHFELSTNNPDVLQYSAVGNTTTLSGNSALPVSLTVSTSTLAFDSTYVDTLRAAVYNASNTAIQYYSNVIVHTTVLAKPPIWEVNPFEFQHSMNMVVQLDMDTDPYEEELSEDEFDKVAVFNNGQIRGVANIERVFTQSGWKYLAYLDVYSYNAFGDSLSFRLWDADKGKQYGSEEDGTIIFADNGIVGSNLTPKKIHAKGLVQCLTLHQGWNWISFNVEANDMSINEVLEGLRYSQTGDIFRGHDGYAQYQNGIGWIGTLGSIANGESYMIYIQAETDELCLVGEAIDALANPITLDPGWNWVGYTAQTPDSLSQLMSSVNFVNGDIVRSQTDGFAQNDGNSWSNGNLQILKPGQGYRLYVQNPMDITYPQFMLADWSYNPSCYEYSMLITGVVSVNLIESTDINDIIAAMVPTGTGTCSPLSITQGSSSVRYIPELNRYMVFLTVYGDASAINQPIMFKMYDNSEPAEYILHAATDPNTGDTMRFVPDNHIGTLQNPYPFQFSTCDEVIALATPAGCAGNEGTATAHASVFTGRLGKTCTNPETFTLAAGSNTNYTPAISPFATAWKKVRFQYIYTAQELRDAGLHEGTISRLGFDVVQKNSVSPIQNFTIKMMGTNQSSLNSNVYAIGAEIVYERDYTTQLGWNDIPLDYAFDWDGVSNIIVQVCYDSQTDNYYNDIVRTASTSYTSTIGMFDNVGAACAFEMPQVAYAEKPLLRLGACNVDYQWSNGTNAPNLTNLTGGIYTVTVSFGNGCVQVRDVTVTSFPVMLVSPSFVTAALCNGSADGTAQAVITGGTAPYTYLWNNGQTTATATNLAAGTYTATITDANGCTKQTTANITQPTVLTATGNVVNVLCNGGTGSATVAPAGGTPPYTYNWDNGQTIPTATGLGAGVHSVTITDAHGCNKVLNNINITQPAALLANVNQTSSPCNGLGSGAATVNVVGGVPPYNYIWSNGQTTANIANLSAGAYGVTVQDANACTVSVNNVTIIAPQLLSIFTSISPVACNGTNTGSVTATTFGGATPYTYLWSNGQTTATATNLSIGTYTATITDGNGCTIQTTANVTQPSALSAATSNVASTQCSNPTGSATAVPTGGVAPYTYLWSDGQTTATASNLWAGNYTATITDVNGCTTTTTATIVAPAALTVLADGSEILSSTVFVHQTEIIVDGGVAPYSYQWDNNGYVSYDISYDAAGNGYVSLQYGQTAVWAVTITDSNDCGVVVLGNTPIDEPLSISNYTIANDDGTNSGSVSIVAEGGTAPYSYEWFGPSDWVPVGSVTSNQLSNLPSGWYTVYVTDAAGNEISGWYWVASSTRGRGKTDDLDLGDASSLSVYPNPVKQHATIEYIGMQNEYVYVELFDITGKSAMKLFEGEVQAAKPLFLDIDSRQLTPGAYVCQVRNTKDVIQTIRLVIAK